MPSRSRPSGLKNPTNAGSATTNGSGHTTGGTDSNRFSDKATYPQPNVTSGSRANPTNSTTNSQKQFTMPTTAEEPKSINGSSTNGAEHVAPAVNRKKQKRRQKQAARLAAEQPLAAGSTPDQAYMNASTTAYKDLEYAMSSTQAQMAQVEANGYSFGPSEYGDGEEYEPGEGEDQYYTDEDDRLLEKSYAAMRNKGLSNPQPLDNFSGKAKKKKRNRLNSTSQPNYQPSYDAQGRPYSTSNARYQPPPPPPPPGLSTAALRSAHNISKDRIWNTSTVEERERIKEFWLSLGEQDRRSLVKIEKEAVLKKMKEQQKHSCSCTVCGRKRTAIEEELEVLYDAYYEELEQYANHQPISLDDGTPMIHSPMMYGPPTGQMPPRGPPQELNNTHSGSGRIQELADDDLEADDDEDSYDEDEDEDISDGEPVEQSSPAADFFNFGNSLTVQGGILTVADDLLKNDGKKFIEMMEQLAERRMQREEDAQHSDSRFRHQSMQPHNHDPPLDDDGDYDEEEDEDYDSQEEDEEDYDEMEAMTEEQRMEEGRRMFQIFAARMFEQRVLTAYREKVARERQQKLIEELDEESRLDTQREAKKAKEAQKKKEKKRQQKQAKDEEKARREAEKAAEEATLKAAEEKRLEEQRQKKEEQRKKREAEKKAQEEEKQRKEAEKQKRLQEAREQQAELERKQREQKEREKRKREEVKKKEREEREAKEKEIRGKKEREAAERKDRESRAKSEKEDRDRKKHDEQAAKQPVPAPVVPNVPASMKSSAAAAPQVSNLIPSQTTSSHASPHLHIATPVVPKAPTPIRPRQASFQGSHNSSPKTSVPPAESSTTSPSVPSQATNMSTPTPVKHTAPLQGLAQQPPTSSLTSAGVTSGPPSQPPGFSGTPAMSGSSFPTSFGPIQPNVSRGPNQEPSMYQHQTPFNGNHFRPFMPPNGLPYPPGFNGSNAMRPLPQGRGGPMEPPSPQIQVGPINSHHMSQYIPRDTMPSHSHSRQSSASFERSTFENPSVSAPTQPIARPAPIQRPSSVAPHQQGDQARRNTHGDVDDLSNHLGSSALLDDTDVPLSSNTSASRRGSTALGGPRPTRHGFNGSSSFQDPIGTAKTDGFRPPPLGDGIGNTWNTAQAQMHGPPLSGPAPWSNAPRPGWPTNNTFGLMGGPPRPSGSRAVTIRLLVCQACNKLTAHPPQTSRGGYHNVQDVLRTVDVMKPSHEGPISMEEMLDICDTEGNTQNGGGSFKIDAHGPVGMYVKFEPGRSTSMSMGEIGSPVTGGAMPAFGGGRGFQQPGF